jgi:hypothetical protein
MEFKGYSQSVGGRTGNTGGCDELCQGVRPRFKCGKDAYGFI